MNKRAAEKWVVSNKPTVADLLAIIDTTPRTGISTVNQSFTKVQALKLLRGGAEAMEKKRGMEFVAVPGHSTFLIARNIVAECM